VVEFYVAPADFEVKGETIKKGSWVLVTKASDEVWEQIKKGDITSYSIAGTAGDVAACGLFICFLFYGMKADFSAPIFSNTDLSLP